MDDGSVVDARSIKRWLSKCEKTHTTCGKLATKNAQDLKLLLIDVFERKIINADSSFRYVALSYVWGSHSYDDSSMLQTTRASFEELKQTNALGESAKIPTVIKDAMEFVRAVGERYLWVDRLSIVQDDNEHKHYYIHRMDVVFAVSVFTIVAASVRHSDDSLPGIRRTIRPPLLSFIDGETFSIVTSPHREIVLNDTVYQRRGWTFQEMHLSRRCVIFTETHVMCECREQAVSEVPKGPYGYQKHMPVRPLRRLEQARVYTYANLVRVYTTRQLTYESDLLNAFAGLLSFLSARMDWGFAFGLPGAELSLALLWCPQPGASRRQLIDPSQRLNARLQLPSWSWIGW
ncbi:uncharacterized protein K452DRAFT_269073, partial [Aplosporella prunicola CBS 121167]